MTLNLETKWATPQIILRGKKIVEQSSKILTHSHQIDYFYHSILIKLNFKCFDSQRIDRISIQYPNMPYLFPLMESLVNIQTQLLLKTKVKKRQNRLFSLNNFHRNRTVFTVKIPSNIVLQNMINFLSNLNQVTNNIIK